MRSPLEAFSDRGIVTAEPEIDPHRNGKPHGPAFRPRTVGRWASDIEPQKIPWLWRSRIPAARLTIIAGDGGTGKSFLSLAIAATLSRGADWPDQPGSGGEPGVTCLLNAEDNGSDTIVPRLIACEADRSKVHIIDGVQRSKGGEWEFFNLLDDARTLERTIEETKARMCVVDPVGAFLGGVDSHKDASVRQALGPLAAVAERTGCAIVAVMHTNKTRGSKKVSDKVVGSVGFTNAARMAWFIVEDPGDEQRRMMLPFKHNIVERPDGLAFKIEDGAVRWLGTVDTRAEDVLVAGESGGSATKGAEAEQWLEDYLATGAIPAKQVEQAAKGEGLSFRTLRRAKDALGVKSSRPGGVWHWELDRFEVTNDVS